MESNSPSCMPVWIAGSQRQALHRRSLHQLWLHCNFPLHVRTRCGCPLTPTRGSCSRRLGRSSPVPRPDPHHHTALHNLGQRAGRPGQAEGRPQRRASRPTTTNATRWESDVQQEPTGAVTDIVIGEGTPVRPVKWARTRFSTGDPARCGGVTRTGDQPRAAMLFR